MILPGQLEPKAFPGSRLPRLPLLALLFLFEMLHVAFAEEAQLILKYFSFQRDALLMFGGLGACLGPRSLRPRVFLLDPRGVELLPAFLDTLPGLCYAL